MHIHSPHWCMWGTKDKRQQHWKHLPCIVAGEESSIVGVPQVRGVLPSSYSTMQYCTLVREFVIMEVTWRRLIPSR